ncbi:terpene synthase family protein [Micromonospora inositola]|uniref:Terpene synthase family, metal binding domain n=1 Tax=Micromonospora inositola TaxID=47865 RepID=A0A1C5J1P5_9ACTN|nr:terpene synthase family protein [Micromonospora inositola]SCG64528.1 Terpene synthase family, metal binding domain [Micromonospora inositola]
MTAPPLAPDVPGELAAAADQGRICALAAKGQRDLGKQAGRYPAIFGAEPFDSALYGSIAMAIAFGAPWCTAEQLRITNRAVLWGFAADWHLDVLATSRQDVERVIDGCLAAADGRQVAADDFLGQLLAELRDDLATVPAFTELRGVWRREVELALTAMAREWEWRADRAESGLLPSLDDYLANAANLACTVVNVAHWIYSGDEATHRHLDQLVTASDEVQRILRLVNDLGTYERDLRWGDLNAIMLVADRSDVEQMIDRLVENCRALLAPLERSCPVQAAYLARQIGFSSGFYRATDFWGVR